MLRRACDLEKNLLRQPPTQTSEEPSLTKGDWKNMPAELKACGGSVIICSALVMIL